MFFKTHFKIFRPYGGHIEIRTQTGCVLSALPPAVGLCDHNIMKSPKYETYLTYSTPRHYI